jgi:hypothetical protein
VQPRQQQQPRPRPEKRRRRKTVIPFVVARSSSVLEASDGHRRTTAGRWLLQRQFNDLTAHFFAAALFDRR